MKAIDKFHIIKMGFLLTHLLFVLTAFKVWSKQQPNRTSFPNSTEILSDKKTQSFK